MCLIVKKGFTLAEVLIVMLILSIIMAAFAPMMTTRNKVDLGSPWKYAANNSDIYYGLGEKQTAIIGQKELKSSDPRAKMLINVNDANEWGKYSYNLNLKRNGIVASLGLTTFGSLALGQSAFGGVFGSKEYILPNDANGYPAIAIGANALFNADEAYTNNIAIGSYSLFKNGNTAENNIAIGHLAALDTHAGDNIALGAKALLGSENGYGNIGIGTNALISGEDNIWDIHQSPDYTIYGSGNYNVAIGYEALPSSHVGNDNVAIGTYAFKGAMTGNPIEKSVAIGANSCQNVEGKYKICIGADSGSDNFNDTPEMEVIFIGKNSYYNNRIASILVQNDYYHGYAGRIELNQPTYINGDLFVKGEAYTPSDKRLKNIKSENKSGLDILRNLKVYNYIFKDDKYKTERVGLIAQDVQKVLPEAVDKNKDGFLKLKQENITYLMFNAIKQLDTLVQGIINELKILEAQRTEIIQLKKQNAELEKRIERLEAKIK